MRHARSAFGGRWSCTVQGSRFRGACLVKAG
jgi:hypothetical protein